MLLSEIKTAETASRTQKRSAQEAIAAYAKRLKKTGAEYDGLKQAERGEQIQRELEIVEAYLPRPLSREEIQGRISELIYQE